MINLNELRDIAYQCAQDHGFHDKEYSDSHYLMLVITELSEAVEADRKGKRVDTDAQSAYDLCQKDKFYAYAYDNYIKGTIEEELADTVIRLLDLFGLRNIFLDELSQVIIKHFKSRILLCVCIITNANIRLF